MSITTLLYLQKQTTVDALNCYLLELVSLKTGKILWGLDCEIQELQIVIEKSLKYRYLKSKKCTDCEVSFPLELRRDLARFDKFLKNRKVQKSKFCKNCK